MDFRTENHFDTELGPLLAAYADPGLVATVGPLAPLSAGELVDHRRQADTVTSRVRYAYLGELPPGASRIVDPARLSWVQVTEIDLARRRAFVTLQPDNYADRLDARATERFAADPAGGTTRTVEGKLQVHLLMVGGAVERALVSGLTDWLAAEATVVDRWATARAG